MVFISGFCRPSPIKRPLPGGAIICTISGLSHGSSLESSLDLPGTYGNEEGTTHYSLLRDIASSLQPHGICFGEETLIIN